MRLHGYFRSSTSYRLRIALNLKGISYDQTSVDLKAGEHLGDAYKTLNPYATVPALETDQGTLYQSLALLDWLEETHPSPSFFPQDKALKQICRELYFAIASEIHAVNNLAVLKYLRADFEADQSALEKWYQHFIHRTFEPVEARLNSFVWASKDLPFGVPSFFEIVLIPQIYNARRWNTDLAPFPLLCKIDQACMAMPAFKTANPDIQPDA